MGSPRNHLVFRTPFVPKSTNRMKLREKFESPSYLRISYLACLAPCLQPHTKRLSHKRDALLEPSHLWKEAQGRWSLSEVRSSWLCFATEGPFVTSQQAALSKCVSEEWSRLMKQPIDLHISGSLYIDITWMKCLWSSGYTVLVRRLLCRMQFFQSFSVDVREFLTF